MLFNKDATTLQTLYLIGFTVTQAFAIIIITFLGKAIFIKNNVYMNCKTGCFIRLG